jgi:hypothetical protein
VSVLQRSLAGLFPDELEQLVVGWGEPAYRGRQVFHNLQRRAASLSPRPSSTN